MRGKPAGGTRKRRPPRREVHDLKVAVGAFAGQREDFEVGGEPFFTSDRRSSGLPKDARCRTAGSRGGRGLITGPRRRKGNAARARTLTAVRNLVTDSGSPAQVRRARIHVNASKPTTWSQEHSLRLDGPSEHHSSGLRSTHESSRGRGDGPIPDLEGGSTDAQVDGMASISARGRRRCHRTDGQTAEREHGSTTPRDPTR